MTEFDNCIKNYRQNLDKSLSLSGETSNFFAEYKAKKLLGWLPNLYNKKINILDFGCGDGTMASYVSKLFPQAKIKGIDISQESIYCAKKKFPTINFYCTENLNEKNSYDLIYSAGVFHHIEFKNHKNILKKIFNNLKINGYFVLFELNPYNILTRRTFKKCPIDKNATMLSPKYSNDILLKFGKISTKYYFFFPAFLKVIRPIEKYLTKIPIGALYATIVQKVK